MTIRPPRPPRRRRRPDQARDVVITLLVAALVVLFLLRSLLAILAVERWTMAWRIVEYPTEPLVSAVATFEPLRHTLVGHFTVSDAIAGAVVGIIALIVLSALAVRRA